MAPFLRHKTRWVALALLIVAVLALDKLLTTREPHVDGPENLVILGGHLAENDKPQNEAPFTIVNKYAANNIVLYSKFRSGSTFTSDFFKKNRQMMYIFEPLRLINPDHYDRLHQGVDILRDILTCNISESANLMEVQRYWLNVNVFLEVEGNPNKGNLSEKMTNAQQKCLEKPNHVIKVIRTKRLEHLEPLMADGVKVVHLVRDPRGVMSSRKGFSPWEYNNTARIRQAAEHYCQGGLEDVEYIRAQMVNSLTSNVYYILRYEDLAQDPRHQMMQLYQFLGVPPDGGVRYYADQVHNKSSRPLPEVDAKTGAFGTARSHPFYTTQAWRRRLSWKNVLAIQEVCQQFMTEFGYVTMNDTEQLLDLQSPATVPYNIF